MIPLFDAIAASPALLGYIKDFASWIVNALEQAQKRKAEQVLAEACGLSKKTKDTSKIDQAFKNGT